MQLSDWTALVALIVSLTSAFVAWRQWHLAKAAEDRAQRAEARYQPPWRLEHVRGDTYSLVNDGYETVHDVEVAGGIRCSVQDGDPKQVPAGSALTVFIVGAMGAPPYLTVTWRRDTSTSGENRLVWSRPAHPHQ